MRCDLLLTAVLAVIGGPGAAPQDGRQEGVAVLVPVAEQPTWRDDAFLAAVPASCVLGNGEPIVLAIDAKAPLRPEVLDFLRRYAPARLFAVAPRGEPAVREGLPACERLIASSAGEAAATLALHAWGHAPRVVLYDTAERGAALTASTLAARLGVPLFPARDGTLAAPVQEALSTLATTEALFVGAGRRPRMRDVHVERLEDAADVVEWLADGGMAIHYLAAVHPQESVAGRDRHLTLAAPLLAAGRSGMVAPLELATDWKRRFPAETKRGEAPAGAADSSAGWRSGEILLENRSHRFVTGRDPGDGKWWVQVDLNGDGRFRARDEQPRRTGDSIEFAGRRWTVDVDADETARGQAVWLTSPTAADVRAALQRLRDAAGDASAVRHLCLVGWPNALPMAVVADGHGIDADLVSDRPYAQTDEDPFVELATARFIAEDLPSATLLACRGLARDDLPDPDWRGRFATAEWETLCRAPLEAAGLRFAGHHSGEAPVQPDSPLTEAGVIVHGSHAMWTTLGETYRWDSEVLLAPALVESSGCSTASLDQDPQQRSVAARLLRNGAVAFVGNTRRGVAEQNLFRSALWNALLDGATLGEAHRKAQNRVLVAVLERQAEGGGRYHYQLHNHAVYGDPALDLGLQRADAQARARLQQRGRRVTVRAPREWHRVSFDANDDWDCPFPRLYAWRGAGAAVESTWYGPGKRNEETLYVYAEARTERSYSGVEPLGEAPPPLGWTGFCFVDEHADGSRTLHWRVRMLDGDMTTGEIGAQVERLQFRLTRD